MRQNSSAKWQWLAPVILFFMLGSSAVAQVPQISVPLVPSSAAPGSVVPTGPGLALTVNGTGFVAGSLVYWNGTPRVTIFVSSTSLMATITAEDVESPGTAWVTVENPGVATRSNAAYFGITNPTTSVSFTRADYATGAEPNSIASGDFNGDGKVDLVVPNTLDNTVGVLLGSGDGSFQPMVAYSSGGDHPAFVAVADVNGDRKLDLIVTNYYSNNVGVLIGNGDGTFQAVITSPNGGPQPYGVAVADFDGDGKLDLAVANVGYGNISILQGNGSGTFQVLANYTVGSVPSDVVVGDFNRDGKLDLAVANEQSDFVSILLGNGNGTFQAAVNYGGGGVTALSCADLNGDGNLDLIGAGGAADSAIVRLGNGDGTFQAPLSYPAGNNPFWIAVGDFNGDGKIDAATANFNYSQSSANVLLGNGDGTLQSGTGYPAPGTNPLGVTLGDFNGDGRMDLAVENSAVNTVSILLQPPPSPTDGAAQLNGNNTFTGNQTVNGTVAATTFVGSGSGLTGVTASNLDCVGCVSNTQMAVNYAAADAQAGNALNALKLGGLFPGAFALLVSPGFTGTPTAPTPSAGTNTTQLATTAYVNNPNNIYSGWHQAQSVGSFLVTPSDQGKLITTGQTNVTLPASIPPLGWWVDIENHGPTSITLNPNGNQLDYIPSTITLAANQGIRVISAGSNPPGYFTQRGMGSSLSMTFSLSVPALKPSTCTTSTFTFTGASDGDTTALGIPSALMAAGTMIYSAWVSAADTVTIRACDINPNGPPTAAASGSLRVDIWKH